MQLGYHSNHKQSFNQVTLIDRVRHARGYAEISYADTSLQLCLMNLSDCMGLLLVEISAEICLWQTHMLSA